MTIETRSLSDTEIKAIAARIDRPLVLVGMMGVGKSTIGRKLAQLLDLTFRDADDEIEKAAPGRGLDLQPEDLPIPAARPALVKASVA